MEDGSLQPIALWRALSLDERAARSESAVAQLDAHMARNRPLPAWKDVASVGAGLAGISSAMFFLAAGVDVALLEKTYTAGGVWRSSGNAFSRVNSSEPSYRLPYIARRAPKQGSAEEKATGV